MGSDVFEEGLFRLKPNVETRMYFTVNTEKWLEGIQDKAMAAFSVYDDLIFELACEQALPVFDHTRVIRGFSGA